MKHQGSCHCQNVKFEIESDLKEALECNCSICQRRGHLMVFTPESQFKLKSGENSLSHYQWNKKTIDFMFCTNCGIPTFAKAKTPDGATAYAVNLRALENVDIKSVPVNFFDGKHKL